MASEPRALENGLVVPIQAEPFEAIEDDLGVFIRGTRFVGVFDPQEELAAFFAGEEPVEECSPGSSDVQISRGGWGEANSDRHRERRRGDSNPR